MDFIYKLQFLGGRQGDWEIGGLGDREGYNGLGKSSDS